MIDDIDAKVWARATMAMMRLLPQNAVPFRLSHAGPARQVFRRSTGLVAL